MDEDTQTTVGNHKEIHHRFPGRLAHILRAWSGKGAIPIVFEKGVCHRCNQSTPSLRFCLEMYGGRFEQSHGWFVEETYLKLGILKSASEQHLYLSDTCPLKLQEQIDDLAQTMVDYKRVESSLFSEESTLKRGDREIPSDEWNEWKSLQRLVGKKKRAFHKEIENVARETLGFRKVGEGWISETLLLQIVRRILPDLEITHHHRPGWLEGLELDIYLPALRLGIEYQGLQHFYPIKPWGGAKALVELKKRDARKIRLCKDAGVRLITVHYSEPLTEEYIRSLLFN